jgi:hypothetical protein
MKISSKRKKLIINIHKNITNCMVEDKKIILCMIVSSGVSTNKLYEEGTGTRVLYKVLSDSLLEELDAFILNANKKTMLNLDSSSDESGDDEL